MTISLARLLAEDAVHPAGADRVTVTGITADSRAVAPGFVFAALPGTKVDGTKFLEQAFAQGAVAAIVPIGTPHSKGITIQAENPRRLLAHIAARFAGVQPETIVAVTGTNGKTSVSVFVRQIWKAMGFRAASLGTIGVVGPEGASYLAHTTPDPVQLAELAASLRADHVKHLAVEASSHGLAQYRLDGLQLTAAAFTNLTRDHLDYHDTFESYFDAKMRLFEELLPPGSPAIVNMDSDHADQVVARAQKRGLSICGVGRKGNCIKLVDVRTDGLEQHLTIEHDNGRGVETYRVALPLVGDFQASNALVAAGLVIASGGEASQTFHALESLVGATGRLELVGRTDLNAPVFVDYAHTPDALENAILALRPFTHGKLHVVFGCGGDRDPGKRELMGQVAAKHADHVIVTDDNPRSEDPALIRRAVLNGAPGATEIGDRASAIRAGVNALKSGDVLLIAGKGHEEGQIIGTRTIPFSDHAAARAALKGEDYA
jgi:UDP-N-acetylmuramoyl-L-alanyl-D-glutamate--2,6-diaminopimelate ligase